MKNSIVTVQLLIVLIFLIFSFARVHDHIDNIVNSKTNELVQKLDSTINTSTIKPIKSFYHRFDNFYAIKTNVDGVEYAIFKQANEDKLIMVNLETSIIIDSGYPICLKSYYRRDSLFIPKDTKFLTIKDINDYGFKLE